MIEFQNPQEFRIHGIRTDLIMKDPGLKRSQGIQLLFILFGKIFCSIPSGSANIFLNILYPFTLPSISRANSRSENLVVM
jgi:hypothetical protein